jgi:hypothetical protein
VNESVLQPQLGTPIAERGSGIGGKEPNERALARATVLTPLLQRAAIARAFGERVLYQRKSWILQRRQLERS